MTSAVCRSPLSSSHCSKIVQRMASSWEAERQILPRPPGFEHSQLIGAPTTGLRQDDVSLGTGSHVRVVGKGRKERCTPLSRTTRAVLAAWMREPPKAQGQPLFPNARGGQLSAHGLHYLLAKHVAAAGDACPSLRQKRVTPHVLRHTTAMDLLQQGVEQSVIALWLGHESIETTQMYLDADLALKERILEKTTPPDGKPGRYRPDDRLLAFLKAL